MFLRRAFGPFTPAKKRQITENLGEFWGMNKDSTADLLEKELTRKSRRN